MISSIFSSSNPHFAEIRFFLFHYSCKKRQFLTIIVHFILFLAENRFFYWIPYFSGSKLNSFKRISQLKEKHGTNNRANFNLEDISSSPFVGSTSISSRNATARIAIVLQRQESIDRVGFAHRNWNSTFLSSKSYYIQQIDQRWYPIASISFHRSL